MALFCGTPRTNIQIVECRKYNTIKVNNTLPPVSRISDAPTLTAASTHNPDAAELHRYSASITDNLRQSDEVIDHVTPSPTKEAQKDYFITEALIDVTTMVTDTLYYDVYDHGSLFDLYDDEGSGGRTSTYGRPGSQGVNNYENISNSTKSGNSSETIQFKLKKLAESAWREQLPPGTMESDIGHYLMTHSAFPIVEMAQKGPVRAWVS